MTCPEQPNRACINLKTSVAYPRGGDWLVPLLSIFGEGATLLKMYGCATSLKMFGQFLHN